MIIADILYVETAGSVSQLCRHCLTVLFIQEYLLTMFKGFSAELRNMRRMRVASEVLGKSFEFITKRMHLLNVVWMIKAFIAVAVDVS